MAGFVGGPALGAPAIDGAVVAGGGGFRFGWCGIAAVVIVILLLIALGLVF